MNKKTLEKKITELFEAVKNSYYRPAISGPEIIWDEVIESGKGTAFLNWLKFVIGVNVPFVEKLAACGNMDGVIRGLFSHEFGHYFLHPQNLTMQLYLSYMAEKAFSEKAQIIYPLYTDFENNCLVVDNGMLPDDLKELLKSHWSTCEKSPLEAALFKAYDTKLNLGLDIDLGSYEKNQKDKIEAAVKELEQVLITPSQDYGLQYSQVQRFGSAILPLLEGCGSGIGIGSGAGRQITPEDIKELPEDLRQKIEDELRKMITKLPRDLYDKIKKHFLGNDDQQDKSKGIGLGSVDEKTAEKQTVDYYRDLAKEFGIYVRPKRSLSHSLIEIQDGRKDFKPSDSPLGIDLRFSGGKILPGLTQVSKKGKIRFPATREIIPRLLLYKDASGSMNDPSQSKCYGTIAGTIFVLSYLRSRAEVGVAIFDSEASEVFYSLKEDELIAKLCSYKGGGTSVDIAQLKKDLEKKSDHMPLDASLDIEELKRNPYFRKYLTKAARITGISRLRARQMTDFVIITDGGIANLDELVAFFKENEEYRPTILHTGGFSLSVPGYDDKTSGVYEGITILKAETREDMISMTRKAVRDNLLARYQV